jgi:hypothetical protein
MMPWSGENASDCAVGNHAREDFEDDLAFVHWSLLD